MSLLPGSLEPLPREFFDRPATEVAPELLGCVLVHGSAGSGDGRVAAELVAAELVEVEAYMGSADPASHAFRGMTARNEVMFGAPGHTYVYFTYGMHFCVNLVCQPAGVASAVLLRAGRIVAGGELAAQRRLGGAGAGVAGAGPRPGSRQFEQLASGPARLCQALGIAREQNGLDACDPGGELRICAPTAVLARGDDPPDPPAVLARGDDPPDSPAVLARGDDPPDPPGWVRVASDGIATGPRVGVSSGAEVPWRYWIAGDRAVSAYRPHVPRKRTAGAAATN
ncbi:MAG TPA: DNA-3-methyladenine glycosylase [Streptosporangiaceae bacterium]|nr:DNA-3-methyladenine glycosylase [Streptosporangiaceae bacterium]